MLGISIVALQLKFILNLFSSLLHPSHPAAGVPGRDDLPVLLSPDRLRAEAAHHGPLQEGHLEGDEAL